MILLTLDEIIYSEFYKFLNSIFPINFQKDEIISFILILQIFNFHFSHKFPKKQYCPRGYLEVFKLVEEFFEYLYYLFPFPRYHQPIIISVAEQHQQQPDKFKQYINGIHRAPFMGLIFQLIDRCCNTITSNNNNVAARHGHDGTTTSATQPANFIDGEQYNNKYSNQQQQQQRQLQ